MNSNFGSNGDVNRPRTMQGIARKWLVFTLIAGSALLRGVPVNAAGQIFAEIYLYNNTTQTISIPFSDAKTGQLWGTHFNTLDLADEFVVMPDGTPPRMLGPGQTMMWGTKSNGGFLATTGTGGSLKIEEADQSIAWSAPWSYFNALGGACDGEVSSLGGFGSNLKITGGAISGSGGGGMYHACVFEFVINQQ